MGKFKDLTGRQFGRLTAIEPLPPHGKNTALMWACKCECGGKKSFRESAKRAARAKLIREAIAKRARIRKIKESIARRARARKVLESIKARRAAKKVMESKKFRAAKKFASKAK